MRVHTVVVASLIGMLGSSGLAWALSTSSPQRSDAPAWPDARAALDAPAVLAAPVQAAAAPTARSEFEVEGTLQLAASLGHAAVQTDRTDETFVFINLTAQSEPVAAPLTPSHVTIVVDRSGSMRGSRMNTALTAARGMVSQMRDGDVVSVVSYNERAQVEVFPTRLDNRSRQRVLADVSNIRASGHTCLSCGVERALSMSSPASDLHRVLVLSDGKANRGQNTTRGFSSLATMARTSQTPVTSVGIGVDYDERLLSSISRGTNGAHHFVERLDQLQPVFRQELDQLQQTVATTATVEVTLAPDVELLEVLDRGTTRQGNRLVVPFGSFAAGEDKTLLLRVRLPARQLGIADVGSIALRYTDAASGLQQRANGVLEVAVADTKDSLNPAVAARVSQSKTIRDLSTINDLIDAGRDAEARTAVARGRARLKRERAEAEEVLPLSAAADTSFADQSFALGLAGANAAEAAAADKGGGAAAPKTRKAASKRNAALAHPFN